MSIMSDAYLRVGRDVTRKDKSDFRAAVKPQRKQQRREKKSATADTQEHKTSEDKLNCPVYIRAQRHGIVLRR